MEIHLVTAGPVIWQLITRFLFCWSMSPSNYRGDMIPNQREEVAAILGCVCAPMVFKMEAVKRCMCSIIMWLEGCLKLLQPLHKCLWKTTAFFPHGLYTKYAFLNGTIIAIFKVLNSATWERIITMNVVFSQISFDDRYTPPPKFP